MFFQKKSVSILGATGSIGTNTLDLISAHRDKFEVRVLTAQKNVKLLAAQARAFQAEYAVIGDESLYQELQDSLAGTPTRVMAGRQAVIEAAAIPVDWTMAAIVGSAGVESTMAAIQQGKIVALANKESLVCAGRFVMEAVGKSGATLLPVDSEHNAIFQVFDSKQREYIERIILTASGGPFLRKGRAELGDVTPEEAVRHPKWAMGAKISIDSATMMNKSLEIIEAHYLFNVPSEKIDILIHPQSTIHSLVEYIDGSVLLQMGATDMRTPIAHTLAWPNRIKTAGNKLNFANKLNLELEPIDTNRFPAIKMARDVLRAGEGFPTVFNAANEIAVAAFLSGKLKFSAIESVVEKGLQSVKFGPISCLEDVFALDRTSRQEAERAVGALSG